MKSLVALATLAVVACSSQPPAEDPQQDDPGPSEQAPAAAPASSSSPDQPPAPSGKPSPPPPSADGGASCPYSGPPIDVSQFKTCRIEGVCIPSALIPDDQKKRLATCDGGYCVPKQIVINAGTYLPPSCTSLAGGEGRCYSTVFPDIDAAKDHLPQDTCGPNERCAPCYDPITGDATGSCSSVSCDSPKKPKVVFGDCCNENGKTRGRCLPTSLVGADASNLATKECKQGQEVCVPSETLAPNYVPPACKASSLIGDYDGVCISDCVPRDFLADISTDQGNCTQGFFCAPCKNPLTGAPTGAPGCK